MKKRITIFCSLLLLILGWIHFAQANPFRHRYVCVPKIRPSETGLDFRIQDGGKCTKDEIVMRVFRQEDGVIVLLPSEAPLPPQDHKDLEEFKSFHGIGR